MKRTISLRKEHRALFFLFYRVYYPYELYRTTHGLVPRKQTRVTF